MMPGNDNHESFPVKIPLAGGKVAVFAVVLYAVRHMNTQKIQFGKNFINVIGNIQCECVGYIQADAELSILPDFRKSEICTGVSPSGTHCTWADSRMLSSGRNCPRSSPFLSRGEVSARWNEALPDRNTVPSITAGGKQHRMLHRLFPCCRPY